MARSKKKHSQLNDVGLKISGLQQEIRQLERQEISRRRGRKTTSRPRKEIPKPKGIAGRNPPKGYRLQDAMGLADNKRRYNKFSQIIRHLAQKYLDLSKTINQQKKIDIFNIISLQQAQGKHKYLRQFTDGWPIRDFLGQFLRNCNARRKRHKDHDSDDDTDVMEGQDPSDIESMNSDTDSDRDRESDGLGNHESEDDEIDKAKVPEKIIRKSKTNKTTDTATISRGKNVKTRLLKRKAHQLEETSESDGDAAPALKKVAVQPNLKHNSRKTCQVDTDSDEDVDPAPKVKEPRNRVTKRGKNQNNDGNDAAPVSKIKAAPKVSLRIRADREDVGDARAKSGLMSEKQIQFPVVCPCGDCNEPVPTAPGAELLELLKIHVGLVKKHGAGSNEVFRSSLMVHIELDTNREKTRHLNLANLSGWPVKIDFKTVPDRILAMQDKLTKLVLHEGATGSGAVQDALRDRIAREGLGSDFARFAKLKHHAIPELIIKNSRPGYYGERGSTVIQSTLLRMFDPATTPSTAFAPLSMLQFTTYVLVPFIAVHLIAQDLTCSIPGAYQEMIDSGDAGTTLQRQGDTDEELDSILKTNNQLARQGRRVEQNGDTSRQLRSRKGKENEGVRPRPHPRPRSSVPESTEPTNTNMPARLRNKKKN